MLKRQPLQHNGHVYVVRGERNGASESHALAEGFCSIGWNRCPNPFTNSYDELKAYAIAHWTPPGEERQANVRRDAKQIWKFAHEPELDRAIVVMPRYGQDTVALGICASTAYLATQAAGTDPDPVLRRNVVWLHDALPRADFSAATQVRFNKPRDTVSRVSPNGQAIVVKEIISAVDALLARRE